MLSNLDSDEFSSRKENLDRPLGKPPPWMVCSGQASGQKERLSTACSRLNQGCLCNQPSSIRPGSEHVGQGCVAAR
jgi:hypothetical protein